MLFHGQGEQELTSSKPQVCNRHFTRHNMSQPYNLRLHSAPPGSPGTCVCASCCRTGGGSAQITLVTVTVFDCLPHDCGVQFQCTSLQSSLTHLLHNLPFLQWILDLGAIHTLPILRAVFVQDVQAKQSHPEGRLSVNWISFTLFRTWRNLVKKLSGDDI